MAVLSQLFLITGMCIWNFYCKPAFHRVIASVKHKIILKCFNQFAYKQNSLVFNEKYINFNQKLA